MPIKRGHGKQKTFYVDAFEFFEMVQKWQERGLSMGGRVPLELFIAYVVQAVNEDMIEYHKLVEIIQWAETPKLHGQANQGLRFFHEWARQNKFTLEEQNMSEKSDPRLIETIIAMVNAEAAKFRSDAADAGDWGDRGASIKTDQIRFYRAGQNGTIPAEWTKYKVDAERLIRLDEIRHDPDFAAYERIRRMIEGDQA